MDPKADIAKDLTVKTEIGTATVAAANVTLRPGDETAVVVARPESMSISQSDPV